MRINVINIHFPISQMNYSAKNKNQPNIKSQNKVYNYQPAYYSLVSFREIKKVNFLL